MHTEEHAADIAAGRRRVRRGRPLDPRRGSVPRCSRCATASPSYRFDLAAQAIYEFVWYEFCDWYLELAKPVLQSADASPAAAARHAAHAARGARGDCCALLHPLMPFITEEIWQRVGAARRAAAGRPSCSRPTRGRRTSRSMPPPSGRSRRSRPWCSASARSAASSTCRTRARRRCTCARSARATPKRSRALRRDHRAAVGNLESVTRGRRARPTCRPARSRSSTAARVLAPFARLIDDVSAELARLDEAARQGRPGTRQVRGQARQRRTSSRNAPARGRRRRSASASPSSSGSCSSSASSCDDSRRVQGAGSSA